MRFSLYTLLVLVFFAASLMAFIFRFPAWRLTQTIHSDAILKNPCGLVDDDKKLLVISDKIRVLDRFSARELLSLDPMDEDNEYFSTAAISIKGDAFAYYTKEGGLAVYSLRTLKPILEIPRVINPQNPLKICFSKAGEWVVVSTSDNSYNAYSLTGEKHQIPLVRDDKPFRVIQYFESVGIVYRSARDDKDRGHSCEEFYSVKDGKKLFEYGLPKSGWIGANLAPGNQMLFATDGYGRVAKLDCTKLSDDGKVEFVLQPERLTLGTQAYAKVGAQTLLWIRKLDASREGPCEYSLYSIPDRTLKASFANPNLDLGGYRVDESGGRILMSHQAFWIGNSDFNRFEVVDLKNGNVLFAVRDSDDYQDYNSRGDCVLFYGHHDLKIYVRDHPEWWWGHFFRVETWLLAFFSGLLVHRLIVNVRRVLQSRRTKQIISTIAGSVPRSRA